MAMERVYIETTVPSYLAAKPSENVIAMARQLETQRWWDECRLGFELYASDVVLLECQRGDAIASERRLQLMRGIPLLEISGECLDLATGIFQALQLPTRASDDALHIAIASVHKMDYLLSWNFRHIVNAAMIRKLDQHFDTNTIYRLPQICTPEELMP